MFLSCCLIFWQGLYFSPVHAKGCDFPYTMPPCAWNERTYSSWHLSGSLCHRAKHVKIGFRTTSAKGLKAMISDSGCEFAGVAVVENILMCWLLQNDGIQSRDSWWNSCSLSSGPVFSTVLIWPPMRVAGWWHCSWKTPPTQLMWPSVSWRLSNFKILGICLMSCPRSSLLLQGTRIRVFHNYALYSLAILPATTNYLELKAILLETVLKTQHTQRACKCL